MTFPTYIKSSVAASGRLKPPNAQNLRSSTPNPQVTMCEDDFLLYGRGVEKCDTIILGTPLDMPYPHNDSLILSGLLQVQRVAAKVKRKVKMIKRVKRVVAAHLRSR